MRAMGSFAACLMALAASNAHAVDIYVPDDFSSIQDAIDSSQNGDVIYIRSGFYKVSRLNTQGKPISIIGLDTDGNGEPAAVLSGDFQSTVLVFDSGETPDTRIENLVISLGWSETAGVGSGIDCRDSDPTIQNCIIRDNYISYDESTLQTCQIQCYDSSPRFINSTIQWGTGGISLDGESINGAGPAVLTNCSFEGCYRSPSLSISGADPQITGTSFIGCSISSGNFQFNSIGGVVEIEEGSPLFTECTMTSNNIFRRSGGALCLKGPGNTRLVDCVVSSNRVFYGGDGGGIFVGASSGHAVELDNTQVCYNAPAQIRGNWVDLGGSSLGWYILGCEEPTWNVPGDFASIQAAIDAAQNGESIGIEAGTYLEHSLDTLGKSILIVGRVDSFGRPLAEIDAGSNGPVFIFQSSETEETVVANLVLTGGSSSQGGAVRCLNDSNPSLLRCRMIGNQALNGGGLYCSQSDPVLVGCLIADNVAVQNGGGIFCIDGASPTLYLTNIDFNSAGLRGGGLYSTGDGSPYLSSRVYNPYFGTYTSTSIRGNSAVNEGGGVWIGNNLSGYPQISNMFISENTSEVGGGLYLEESSTGILNCNIFKNHAVSGGGLALGSNTVGTHTISGIRLVQNTASALGGGVACLSGSHVEIDTSTLQFNDAVSGSGIHCADSSIVDLAFDAVVGNKLQDKASQHVGGLEIASGALVTMRGTYLSCNDGKQIEGTYENQTTDINTIASCSNCPADATGDSAVDVNDVLYVISVWGTDDPAGDIDGDGLVAVNDVLQLLAAYGDDCSEDTSSQPPYSYAYYAYYYYYYNGLRVFGHEAAWASPVAMASLIGVFVLVRVRTQKN